MRAPRLTQLAEPAVPLVVDLDETLLATNTLIEALFQLAKHRPRHLLEIARSAARGRAAIARQLWREAGPGGDVAAYGLDLLAFLREEKRRGVPLVLLSAGDRTLADEMARDMGLFDRVLSSEGDFGTQQRKRDLLVAEFGAYGFDYLGDPRSHRSVWQAARKGVRVPPAGPARWVDAEMAEQVLRDPPAGARIYLRALRPRQWLKNALVFVPVLAANQLTEVALLAPAFLAFVAFCLCASSAYLLNDLMDLPSDRHHPDKRHRPLASGQLSPAHALVLMPLLLVGAVAIGLLLPPAFLAVLALYYGLTLAYSFRLKDLLIADVLVLAGLHALRVLAGAAAVAIPPSHWLLTFCVFLFLSLALIKRYAELMVMRALDGDHAHARAYQLDDSGMLAALGAASGYLAVLVLALYVGSDTADGLYPHQDLIWLACILLLYWISYMWLMAHRALMRDDPLVFALHNPVSRVLIVVMGATLATAALP